MAATFTASATFKAIDKITKPFKQMSRATESFSKNNCSIGRT